MKKDYTSKSCPHCHREMWHDKMDGYLVCRYACEYWESTRRKRHVYIK